MRRYWKFSPFFVAFLGFFLLFSLFSETFGQEPIKIGTMYPLGGFAAMYGKPALAGQELAVAEINEQGGVLGRKLKIIVRDTKVKPDVSVREARALILRDKVDFLMGTLSSAVGLAVSAVANEQKILFLATIPKTSALTEEKWNRYTFRSASNTVIEGRTAAWLAAKKPFKKFYTIANDYEYGHKVVESFVEKIKALNKDAQIVGQAWPKLGELEYGSFITAIMEAKPDAVYSALYAGQFTAFVKQARAYGFFDKTTLINVAEAGSTEVAMPMGDDYPEGILTNTYDIFYYPDTAEHREWIKKYQDKTAEEYPPGWAIMGYVGPYFLAEAIKKAGTVDTEKVIDAMEGLTINSPIGPQTMRAFDHQVNRGQLWGWSKKSPDYPFKILSEVQYIPSEEFWNSEDEIKALRAKEGK